MINLHSENPSCHLVMEGPNIIGLCRDFQLAHYVYSLVKTAYEAKQASFAQGAMFKDVTKQRKEYEYYSCGPLREMHNEIIRIVEPFLVKKDDLNEQQLIEFGDFIDRNCRFIIQPEGLIDS